MVVVPALYSGKPALFLLLASLLLLSACDATESLPNDARLPDGSTYSGDIQDGLFHGQGRYQRGDSIYIAEFEAGQPIEGRHLTEYGTYQGEFRDWQYHGEGTYVFVDEYDGLGRMSGIWENGAFIGSEQASSVATPKTPAPMTEQILSEDRQRLAGQINSLAAERPGTVDAYFLAVGGDGTESVFMRDIEVARNGVQEQFDVRERTIRLLNHRDYETLPLASRPSIETALKALDDQMNPEEDLLVVHLVSHGARDGELLLQQPGIELPDLSPQAFGEMLEPLNTRRKLLVVSACFSGHWIDQLKNDHHWIMASARKDRTSFGCGDDSEMTWFTKAVYQEIGLSLVDPDAMFANIEAQIRVWEEAIGMEEEELSYPQMHLGESMRLWLNRNRD